MVSATPVTGHPAQRRVLIVDRSSDNCEVLKTILQRHGVQIFEAHCGDEGLELAKQCHPNVVVLDAETVDSADPSICDDIDFHAKSENASIVLLGAVRKSSNGLQSSEVIAKPYHYGPLIRRIEELLESAEPGLANPPHTFTNP